MRRKEQKCPLVVKHFIKGKFVRANQLRGRHCVIGSSRNARVRLNSEDVAGVVCVLECHKGVWNILDVGSQPDLKLNGKAFVEQEISRKFALEIGDHRLEFMPAHLRRNIFIEGQAEEAKRGEIIHIVKWNGHVLETFETAEEAEAYRKLGHPGIEVTRVARGKQPKIVSERMLVDDEMKKPLAVTLLTILLFFAVLFGLPVPKEQATHPNDNVYTRMIFDSKVLEKKKKQLVSFGKKSPTGTGNGNGSISEGAKGTQSKAIKAVASLRQSGLQSLIGRIAGRASKSAKMLAELTATPTAEASVNHDLGMGMPDVNAATGKAGIIGNGKGFKIGGIGTGGQGSGTGGFKAGTGLGTGAIGNGEVGLEDQDSVVEGGLDKEVIAAVIREHLGQIRYCYERQLSASPDLYGKIKVRFSIDASGDVDTQSIGQTTLNSAMVEECILRRIATWKFPKPKGGTKVLVSYPFLFKSVN